MADGDDDDSQMMVAYKWFLWFCRGLVQWLAFSVGGIGTLLIFWFHWGNKYTEYGVKWFDETTAGACGVGGTGSGRTYVVAMNAYDAMVKAQPNKAIKYPKYCSKDKTTWCRLPCITGDATDQSLSASQRAAALVTQNKCLKTAPASKNGGINCGPLSDNNREWRKIFTFKPNEFLDMFTPITLGGIEFIQHLGPTYADARISGTWLMRSMWLFFLALFGQFGYAGDLGVLCGYIISFGAVLPCIGLAILDHEETQDKRSLTTAEVLPTLKKALQMCKLDGLCPGLEGVEGSTIVRQKTQDETEA